MYTNHIIVDTMFMMNIYIYTHTYIYIYIYIYILATIPFNKSLDK